MRWKRGVHVGGDVAERVADVEADAARVREHVEHEQARPVGDAARVLGQQPGAVRRPEHVLGVPAVLPRALDLVRERRVVAVRRDVVGRIASREATEPLHTGPRRIRLVT